MANIVNTGASLTVQSFNTKAILPYGTGQLAPALLNTNFFDNVKDLFADKAQFINSIKWYPFDLSNFMDIADSLSDLTLGGTTPKWGGTVTYPVKIKAVSNILTYVRIASLDIPRLYENFLDYEPYTNAQIYLPYLGFYALPIKDCMGRTIRVYYSIDFDTGQCTAYVQTTGADGRVIFTASGKIGIDIPVGSENASAIAQKNFENSVKLLASGLAIGGGIMSGNLAGSLLAVKGAETALSTGVNFVTDNQKHYQRGTLSGGQDALPSPTNVYVVIYRPKINATFKTNINEFAKLKGRPLGQVKTLSNLTGFTTVEEIHLEGFGDALKTEVDEIESLLHEGVIL